MTETEWLASGDPIEMLAWLEDTRVARGNKANRYDEAAWRYNGGPSDRKLRLFACACCRQVFGRLNDRSLAAVAVAERYADGEATDGERQAAYECLPRAGDATFSSSGADLAIHCLMPDGFRQALPLGEMLNNSVKTCPECDGDGELVTSHRFTCYVCHGVGVVCGTGEGPLPYSKQAAILRDIIGDPFVEWKVTGPNNPNGCSRLTDCAIYDSAIRPWEPQYARYTPIMGGRIYYAALDAYESRDFTGLGVVADMLEDADAANHHVLTHLRSPGPHVRGCWAVDLILGKQ